MAKKNAHIPKILLSFIGFGIKNKQIFEQLYNLTLTQFAIQTVCVCFFLPKINFNILYLCRNFFLFKVL